MGRWLNIGMKSLLSILVIARQEPKAVVEWLTSMLIGLCM